MKTILSLLAAVLLSAAGAAQAGLTSIAQLPLLNITGTGTVKPNIMLLYDNSGSMRNTFTPDYIDDSTTCRLKSLMASGTRGCTVGQPPFNSADFNKQYYNPKVTYTPPVKADGTSYPSMIKTNSGNWNSVPTDTWGKNATNLTGSSVATTDLVAGFPDLKWCDSSTPKNCFLNTATYTYPTDINQTSSAVTGNPYYYTINVAEYCTDTSLTVCTPTAVGAAAPNGYPEPARVRWCDAKDLKNCQAKYVGNFKYPRFGNTNGGQVAAYGTITIGASAGPNSLSINSVTVAESGGNKIISNGAVNAPSGTNSVAKQTAMATALAASIVAKTGLANQYTACVNTPTPVSSTVPACAAYGITLGSENMLAVIPIACGPAATGKGQGECNVVTDAARSGWALVVAAATNQAVPAQPSTALVTFAGNTTSNKNSTLSSLKLGTKELLSGGYSVGSNVSATGMASVLATKIAVSGTITAYVGGNGVSTACAAAGPETMCLVDTGAAAAAGGVDITLGTLSNKSTMTWSTVVSTAAKAATTDTLPATSTALGTGGSVFARTDIVSTRTTYPKDAGRKDCAAATTCTYDEEMTNFANWYSYYKSRNQMMKSAVGLSFQPITSNFRVGMVSLSDGAAGNAMNTPKDFVGADRATWYDMLYKMDGSDSTPIRQALHAIGKMYAFQDPYNTAAYKDVVGYPCRQNFTFITTDGYWNGGAAATVTNNDNVEAPNRFCTLAKGCVDTRAHTDNTLADVALYWYNGGSNTAGKNSLRTDLEDWKRPTGEVPAGTGDNSRLHMNTYALGLGVDGIMTYEPDYDTAAKAGGDFQKLINGVTTGCPWNGGGAYVWPDAKANDPSGSAAYQSRVDDLWHAAINGHGKYFSASDPKQVVASLRSALSDIEIKVGAAAAAATSTPNISLQDDDIFSDTFTTVKWYGELSKKKIDTITGNVNPEAKWITTKILGTQVGASSDLRTIKMLNTAGGLKDFKYSLSDWSALERSWFDNKCTLMAQCSNLLPADQVIVNSGANLVDWVRGQQQYADDKLYRAYAKTETVPPVPIVLGDIASSKPAFLREPRKAYSLTGYSKFRDDNKGRRATVFVGANDGMLHAFDAGDGTEMWAYVPRITMKKLAVQASTTYDTSHQYTADGSPELADVQDSAGNWHTVLVAGLNGGGSGFYALDVTDPAAPLGMWEFCADSTICAKNDPSLGLSFGNPQFGTWKGKWVVFLTSGYNNVQSVNGVAAADGVGYLYVVDVFTGTVVEKISTNSGSVGTPSGLAKITSISSDPLADPVTTYIYGGDNLGQMWRFDLTAPPTIKVTRMGNAGALQPITTRPDVAMCKVDTKAADGTVSSAARTVVAFGTGRLLDLPDVTNTDVQSVYVIKDSATDLSSPNVWRTSGAMVKQTLTLLNPDTDENTPNTYAITKLPVDLSTQSGWYVDFDLNKGERVNLDPKIVSGGLNVVTNMPESVSKCNVGGTSNVYQLDLCTGSYIASNKIVGSTLSNTSAAVGFIIIRLPSGALKMVTTTADGNTITSGVTPAVTEGTRKVGWRRVKN